MTFRSGTQFVAYCDPEIDSIFHNLCRAAQQGARKRIVHWAKELELALKRQLEQRKLGIYHPLDFSAKLKRHEEHP